MGWLAKMFGRADETALPLYQAVVARARQPHWYLAGQVPDSVDGRFDMIAAILSLVVLRLEIDPMAAPTSASLTERFVEDMDGQLRELGIGDVIVGKHIGKMMSMLGGRIGAYRTGLADGTLDAALVRNLYRGEHLDEAAVAYVRDAMIALHVALAETPVEDVIAGDLP